MRCGGGARGEPARLEHDELSARGPRLVKQRERHTRRLAGAGRRDQHRARLPAERGAQVAAAPRRSAAARRRASPARPSRSLSRRRLPSFPCGRRGYAPTEVAVCSVERSSLTPGPMVEETAARSK